MFCIEVTSHCSIFLTNVFRRCSTALVGMGGERANVETLECNGYQCESCIVQMQMLEIAAGGHCRTLFLTGMAALRDSGYCNSPSPPTPGARGAQRGVTRVLRSCRS